MLQRACRDIWALNLSLLPNPPVAEPLLHLQDTGGDDRSSRSTPAPTQGESEKDKEDEQSDAGESKSGSSSPSSSSSSEAEESDHDSELDRLMRENSETPSSDDDEAQTDRESRKDRSAHVGKKKRTFSRSDYDEPAGTVSVLVLACWTLRLPVTYMDFVKYALSCCRCCHLLTC